MTKDEALRMALEALESCDEGDWSTGHVIHPSYDEDAVAKAITAIKEVLAQPEQEPVAWRFTGIAGLKRYMTQKQYDAQTPEIKKWYEPFKCKNCTTPPQPEQEPVAWWNQKKDSVSTDLVHRHNPDCQPLYITPPQRKPLTDEQIKTIIQSIDPDEQYMPPALRQFARAIEAAHGIKE